MECRWRFVYDDKSTGQWTWQAHENDGIKMASLGVFPTLERCISHARGSGFSFAEHYDIVFVRAGARRRDGAC